MQFVCRLAACESEELNTWSLDAPKWATDTFMNVGIGLRTSTQLAVCSHVSALRVYVDTES